MMFFLFSLFILLIGCNSPADFPSTNIVRYKCEKDEEIKIEYLNDPDHPTAILTYQNRTIPLHLVPSGSGAKFNSDNAAEKLTWFAKDTEGILSQDEIELLKDCRGIP